MTATRIAVLGANGQVGAELCLLLAQMPHVEVVPICRNRLGSAFLRWRGLACRHGSIAHPAQAAALIGDCAVVVNLVLMATTSDPRAARRINARMLANVARAMAPGARHIYFSTMSVYGDREAGQRIALRNSYGADKLRSEGIARREGRRHGRGTWVFRLGHVCGELQGITRQVRAALENGPVPLPDPDRASNTTYVAAIADAILRVADGAVPTGTYDLMNVPQWSWREVFEFEAARCGRDARFRAVGDAPRPSLAGAARRLAGGALLAPRVRRLASRLLPLMPSDAYRKLRAIYAIRSAAADIRALERPQPVLDASLRTPIRDRAAPGLTKTAELVLRPEFQLRAESARPAWPPDLDPADGARR